jgi:hypothetical protein
MLKNGREGPHLGVMSWKRNTKPSRNVFQLFRLKLRVKDSIQE